MIEYFSKIFCLQCMKNAHAITNKTKPNVLLSEFFYFKMLVFNDVDFTSFFSITLTL